MMYPFVFAKVLVADSRSEDLREQLFVITVYLPGNHHTFVSSEVIETNPVFPRFPLTTRHLFETNYCAHDDKGA